MTGKTMPPLPSGSVNLAALHRADARGEDLAVAVERAISRAAPPVPKAEKPEPESTDGTPPRPPRPSR